MWKPYSSRRDNLNYYKYLALSTNNAIELNKLLSWVIYNIEVQTIMANLNIGIVEELKSLQRKILKWNITNFGNLKWKTI